MTASTPTSLLLSPLSQAPIHAPTSRVRPSRAPHPPTVVPTTVAKPVTTTLNDRWVPAREPFSP